VHTHTNYTLLFYIQNNKPLMGEHFLITLYSTNRLVFHCVQKYGPVDRAEKLIELEENAA
jgi:hypothetical protein